MLTGKTPDKVGEHKPLHVPRNALFLIRPKGQQGRGSLNEKRVASRHKAISYLDFFSFFFFLLIFQRNSGDFTVTFGDSLVSHCVWAGVRSDPSRCVVFAAPSSAPRVSGQISSHVIAVFISKLQQIASCAPVR